MYQAIIAELEKWMDGLPIGTGPLARQFELSFWREEDSRLYKMMLSTELGAKRFGWRFTISENVEVDEGLIFQNRKIKELLRRITDAMERGTKQLNTMPLIETSFDVRDEENRFFYKYQWDIEGA